MPQAFTSRRLGSESRLVVKVILMRNSVYAMVGFSSLQLSYRSPYTAPRRNLTRPFEDLPSALQQFFPDHDKATNSKVFNRHLKNSR